MEVDAAEETIHVVSAGHESVSTPVNVVVDDAHPFDLEGYISNYTGKTIILRLMHIVSHSSSIAPEAFNLAVQHIHQGRNPAQFQKLLTAYEEFSAQQDAPLPAPAELASLDGKWADGAIARNQQEKLKLEVELKSYTNNLIKESIRMAHRDLALFHQSLDEYATALKHFSKSREYCTTGQHVLDMCLSVLELLIEQKNYTHLPTYVFKAEAAVDAAKSHSRQQAAAAAVATGTSGQAKKAAPERDAVQTKLDLCTALSNLGQGSFEKAAFHFLRMGPPKDLGDWLGRVVAPGDVAVYGTLCALAAFPRSSIRAQVLNNANFSAYIEQEPYVRELVEAYMASNFKTVLDLLSRYSSRHCLDIHLAPHVNDLTNLIRSLAIILYLQPFSSIKLSRMATAFGWSVEQVERHVVDLIQNGDVKARVDSQNKILQARRTDYRTELFARSIQAAKDMQSANRKLLLRLRLQQADLVVKQPKGQGHILGDYD